MATSTKNWWTNLAMVPLAAEPIGHIGSMPVTNSMLNAWVATVFLFSLRLLQVVGRASCRRGIHNVIEAVIAGLLDQVEKVTESRAKAKAFSHLSQPSSYLCS